MLPNDKLVDRDKMRSWVYEFWAFVGLREQGVEDGVSELADCLEIRRVLCNQLIEAFLLQFISHNELLTESGKVDPSAQEDTCIAKEV